MQLCVHNKIVYAKYFYGIICLKQLQVCTLNRFTLITHIHYHVCNEVKQNNNIIREGYSFVYMKVWNKRHTLIFIYDNTCYAMQQHECCVLQLFEWNKTFLKVKKTPICRLFNLLFCCFYMRFNFRLYQDYRCIIHLYLKHTPLLVRLRSK